MKRYQENFISPLLVQGDSWGKGVLDWEIGAVLVGLSACFIGFRRL